MKVMNVIRKIFWCLSNICYVGIFIYALVSLPILFGYHPLIVLSGSMEPVFSVGGIVYYSEVEKEELHEDDIITYEMEDGTYVTHRIKYVIDGMYQTQGDANNVPDSRFVDFDQIVGKTSDMYLPYIGWYIQFVNDNPYLIGIVVIILLSEFFLENKKNLDIEEKRKEEK